MQAKTVNTVSLVDTFKPILHYLVNQPIELIRTYDRKSHLQADLVAGLTVAIILLPQAIAFAIIAELPPSMGLYGGIIGGIMGALWGSSNQLHTGPTNAISLLIFSALSTIRADSPEQLMIAAGLMACMVGIFQLILGLARLGMLVNFVSHSVIVGFSTGAGLLIGIKQLEPFLGLDFEADQIYENVLYSILQFPQSHWPTAILGAGTIIVLLLIRRINANLPSSFLAMTIASVIVFAAGLDKMGVDVIGQLPSGFPPLADIPAFINLDLVAELSSGALAVAAIGLVATTAITRSASSQTKQRLDSNQEFVGQGMANLLAGAFSGYACAGSFGRTAVNLKSNAQTRMAAVFSGMFALIAILVLGPLAAYLPRTALAGVLIVTAINMIDRAEISRIWQGARGDAAIMLVTFLGTLFLKIEFAVLTGILFSFALYILRTSTPRVQAVIPDHNFKHFTYQPEKPPCIQLAILDIRGDLYFGAVNHVEEAILDYADAHPEQRFLLLRMHHVNHCDFSGIHMLEAVVQTYRDRGGDVFMVRASRPVAELMETTDFKQYLGPKNFLPDDLVIDKLFHHVLDPAVCIYECPFRVFKECQNLPKRVDVANIPQESDIPQGEILQIKPTDLWQQLQNKEGERPMVVDVREPREFRQAHIPNAQSIPLSTILTKDVKFPSDRQIVIVCRSGRRSRRAAYALHKIGINNVASLEGGLLAWEAAGLLEAIG